MTPLEAALSYAKLGMHPAELWHNWLDDAMSIA